MFLRRYAEALQALVFHFSSMNSDEVPPEGQIVADATWPDVPGRRTVSERQVPSLSNADTARVPFIRRLYVSRSGRMDKGAIWKYASR